MRRLLGFFLGGAVLPLAFAAAGPPPGQFLELRTRVEHPPEMGELLCCDVASPLGKFTFVPPTGWRMQVNSSAQKLFLQARDGSAHLEVGFVRENPGAPAPTSTNALRQEVLARFLDANILDQYPCYTASLSGLTFDFQWKPAKEVHMAGRIAFVPCPQGKLEFCLTTSLDKFSVHQPVFGALLTSFAESSDQKAPSADANSDPRGSPATSLRLTPSRPLRRRASTSRIPKP